MVCATSGRTPVWPEATVLSRRNIRARTTSRSTRGPIAGGVRADDVALELGAELGADVPGGERAEAGGDPVDGLGLGGERVDDVPGGGQGLHGLGRQLDAGAVAGDVDDVLRGRAGRAEDDCLHIHIQHPTD